jgi:hypothetical protein
MKRLLTAIATAVFVIYPSICFASYIIHLKDGREFTTDRYWEEGEQIKFKRYGGIIGIRKKLVRGIEEIKDLPKEKMEQVKPETPAAEMETGKREATGDAAKVEKPEGPGAAERAKSTERVKEQQKSEGVLEEEKKKKEQEEAAKAEAFLAEKRRISDELKRVYSAFNDAKAREDKKARDEHFSKIKSLRTKLTELERKVSADYGGELPAWWNEPG